jgi:glycosyltransferase involved in cell wall biosynthesis
MLLIDNGFTAKMSGGDYHIIKVAQQWSKTNDVCFLVPRLGYDYVCNLLVGKVFVYNTPLENHAAGIIKTIILYIVRTWTALLFDAEGQFDVILASSHYPYDVIPAIFLKLRFPRSKFVAYFHSLDIPYRDAGLSRIISIIGNYLGALLVKTNADLVFTGNRYTQNFLLSLGIEKGRVFLTDQGVDVRHFTSQPKKFFDGCFIGRHVKHKGIYDLLRIWEIVRESKPDAKLAICGHGEEASKIDEFLRKKKLEGNVLLLGFVQENEKYEVLRSSRIFIFPSYLEGWGIAIAEAMACGLPVVAYNLPVYKEVFEDKLVTMLLGDVDAMAGQVIFLLENPEVARRIGEEGREFIKRYDWNGVAERELMEIHALVNGQSLKRY